LGGKPESNGSDRPVQERRVAGVSARRLLHTTPRPRTSRPLASSQQRSPRRRREQSDGLCTAQPVARGRHGLLPGSHVREPVSVGRYPRERALRSLRVVRPAV